MTEYTPDVLRKKIKKSKTLLEGVKAEHGIDSKDYRKMNKKLTSYEAELKEALASAGTTNGTSVAAAGNGVAAAVSPTLKPIKTKLKKVTPAKVASPTASSASASASPALPSSVAKNSLKSRAAAFQKAATTPTSAATSMVTPSPKKKTTRSSKTFGSAVKSPSTKSPSSTKKRVSGNFKSNVSSPPTKPKKVATKPTSLKDRSAAFQAAATTTTPTAAASATTKSKTSKFGGTASPFGSKKVGNVKTPNAFSGTPTKSVTPSPAKKFGKQSPFGAKNGATPPGKIGKVKTSGKSFQPNEPGKYGTSQNKNAGTPPPKKSNALLTKASVDASADTRAKAAIVKLKDKAKHSAQVESFMERIEVAGGFPQTRRLSVRDNDIVSDLTKSIHNDPTVTEISIDTDVRFEHVSRALVDNFAESLRSNLHIAKLHIKGVDLGNQFLSSLATSIETNFTMREINLQSNSFTNDALVEFCQSVASNRSLIKVDLSKQNSPIFENAEDTVFEALEQNEIIKEFAIDFKTKQGPKRLKKYIARNKSSNKSPVEGDDLLLDFLKYEVERAEELHEQRKAEETNLVVKDDDWGYLYELSQLFDKYKLEDMVVDPDKDDDTNNNKSSPLRKRANSTDSDDKSLEGFAVPMTADGVFLTEEYIDSYLNENKEKGTLVFDFCNQFKLFKRFPKTDPARPIIVKKFVQTLLAHPRMKDITTINMANSCCADDFFQNLEELCFENEKMLPKLNILNVETNFITEKGAVAIAKCVGSPTTFKVLQVLRLENQKALMSSKAELKLAHALCVNRSVIRFSLRVRNLLERQQINKYIQRNVDFLRQARRHHAIETGTLQERKRNEMEVYFDRIAENDPEITNVEIVGNNRFMALNQEEKIKAGMALANNTHVKTLQMSTLKLDCKFAEALAKSLETNTSIEKVLLDSNAIAGDGLSALMACLSKNSTVIELQVRHQSKATSSAVEDGLCDLLGGNTTLVKLGLEIRSQLAKIKLDKKTAQNREIQRKARVQAGK